MRLVWWLMAVVLVAGSGMAACGGTGGGRPDVVLDVSGDSVEEVAEPLDLGAMPDWAGLECQLDADSLPDSVESFACPSDFLLMASAPVQSYLSSSRSLKTVVDQADGDAHYFLNATKYPIHYDFCSDFLSGNGKPIVPDPGTFSSTEYNSPYRRFLLGSVTYYETINAYAYELAPYDTSSPEMVVKAFDILGDSSFLGQRFVFHPTSEALAKMAEGLPDRIRVVSTEQLFAGLDFVPFNLGEAVGQVRILKVDDLDSGVVYVSPRDIVVLDRVPNDIPVVAAIITEQMQTPLSHINVLSQNRGTPNMFLRNATSHEVLTGLSGKYVRLTVTAESFEVAQVTKAVADEWWDAHKPPSVKVPDLDLTVTDLRDVAELGLDDIPAFGGKASHYGVLTTLGETVPVPEGFAIPVFYYNEFILYNGFDKTISDMLEEDLFWEDPSYRESQLAELRDEMAVADLPPGFEDMLLARMDEKLPDQRLRFRSSTNAEDLDGFTGAGLYTSKTGDPNDPEKPPRNAVRKVWASLWNFRAFEERTYRGIDHKAVGMAILVHRGFPDEYANGVALTNNMFNPMEPAFYINVQLGDVPIVSPPPGVTADQFIYYYYYPGQTMTFLGHSNLVPDGEMVLSRKQAYVLGQALEIIQYEFSKIYARPNEFFAMDVEFKFNQDAGDAEPVLWVKQARPHPGWASGLVSGQED